MPECYTLIRHWLVVIVLGLLAAHSAFAHSFELGPIQIGHPWAAPTNSAEGAAFLVLAIQGPGGDRLIAAATPIAERVEMKDETDKPVDGFDILVGHPIALRPRGRYLALSGIKHALNVGDSFPLTLTFKNAGEIQVFVVVEAIPGD